MASERNALAELAEDLEAIVKDTKSDFYTTRISAAQRIVAELAKYNISLIPQECYGCGVLKTLAKCRAIAEEGDEDGK